MLSLSRRQSLILPKKSDWGDTIEADWIWLEVTEATEILCRWRRANLACEQTENFSGHFRAAGQVAGGLQLQL